MSLGLPDGLLKVISGLPVGHWTVKVVGISVFSQFCSNIPTDPWLLDGKCMGGGLWDELICARTDEAADSCKRNTNFSSAIYLSCILKIKKKKKIRIYETLVSGVVTSNFNSTHVNVV